jgi:hypothetical protein
VIVAPGESFVATTEAFAHAATVAVRIRTDAGVDFLARTTSGVTEDVTVGSDAVFKKTLTAPTTAGNYLIVWDDGTTIDTDELVVSYTAAAAVSPTGHDLCTIADVKTYLPGYSDNTTTNAKLAQLITAESEQFATDAHAEFIATEASQPASRDFDLDLSRRRAYVGALDGAQTVTVALVNDDATTTAVDSAAVSKLYGPRRFQKGAWMPVTELELGSSVLPDVRRCDTQRIRVTATWGFPAVPAFVAEAVAASVILRYISDVATAGTDLADALDSINIRGLVARREDALATLAELQPPFVG